MFGTKELQNKVSELTELNTSLTSQLEEANSKIEGFDDLNKMNAELQENMKKVNGLNEELNSKIEELEANQSDFDSKVADAAQNIVAQTGHEPLADVEDDSIESPSMSIENQYLSIKDPVKRSEFFSQNKKQLLDTAFKK